ncbi:Hypothetical predicted protein [Paramuricea clavata]|uniref:Uncharacterized protein n=1 Tax=Paramuricea clavata TaxID=317549 RepID=A0A6S7G4B7_PARCT|nr:Hypothetical predicted protein [Paramuricea clavata]
MQFGHPLRQPRYQSQGPGTEPRTSSETTDSRFVIMCNSEEERKRYLDLAEKEANIERAVREKVIITVIVS